MEKPNCPMSNDENKHEFMNNENTNKDNYNNLQSYSRFNAIREISYKNERLARLLLITDKKEILSFVSGKLDKAKSELLENAFEMLDEYHHEKDLARETGIPSIRMLMYASSFELLESSEMKNIYYFYILQKDIYISQKNNIKIFIFSEDNNIGTIFRFSTAKTTPLIAASGHSSDSDFHKTSHHEIHTKSQDGKIIIKVRIINNRLEFRLIPNCNNKDEIKKINEQLECGILQFGSLPDIKIKAGFGEFEFNNSVVEEQEELCTLPFIYKPTNQIK